MNCPRCNYPINKGIVWSNCPKCNCRLDRDAAPAQRVKVPQSETPSASATRNVYSSSTNHFEDEYQPRRAAEQKQPKIAYCINCGQKIDEGQSHCSRCGNTLHNNDYSSVSKKPSHKKIWLFSGIAVAILAVVVFVFLIAINPKSPSPEDLLTQQGWNHYNKKKQVESYLGFSNGEISYNPNVDEKLSDLVGHYEVKGDTLIYSFKGHNERCSFANLTDDEIAKMVTDKDPSYDSDQWYVSENFLLFKEKIYVSDDYSVDHYDDYYGTGSEENSTESIFIDNDSKSSSKSSNEQVSTNLDLPTIPSWRELDTLVIKDNTMCWSRTGGLVYGEDKECSESGSLFYFDNNGNITYYASYEVLESEEDAKQEVKNLNQYETFGKNWFGYYEGDANYGNSGKTLYTIFTESYLQNKNECKTVDQVINDYQDNEYITIKDLRKG